MASNGFVTLPVMFAFLQKLLGKSSQRPAQTLALYGPSNEAVDLQAGLDWILECAAKLGLPEADWITFTYGEVDALAYKTYKLATWMKRGRLLPAVACVTIETGRFLEGSRGGLTDYIWYACLSPKSGFVLCVDLEIRQMPPTVAENLVLDIQRITNIEYGYSFKMEFEKGPAIYADGGTLNGRKNFTHAQIAGIAKWSHAAGECKKTGTNISDLLRDIYPLNFLNPHHLVMQVNGQSLKDWIETDPKRGVLKPLIEDKLWTWTVPDNRIHAIRKVLGPERLLISWGDFNTPSGGPLGHTYGAKKDIIPTFVGKSLTKEDERWIADGLAAMKLIFTRYTDESSEHFDWLIGRREPQFGKLLDMVFTAWSQDAHPDRPTPEQTLHAFAAVLGEHLVKQYRMGWYVVDDEYGRSLGVCLRGPGGGQTWNHPVDTVAKRIDQGETGFITGIVDAVGEEIKHG